MALGGEFWRNVVPWRREWQTTSAFLPWEPHEQYEEDLPYPASDSRAWVVHPANSLWGLLPLTMVGLMAGCFGSQCIPLSSFPLLPLWEHMESSGLSTWKLGRWCFPLARLVHSLYAAGPTPCWHRTPCPVDFSQATKWEAQHAELYFPHPPSSLLGKSLGHTLEKQHQSPAFHLLLPLPSLSLYAFPDLHPKALLLVLFFCWMEGAFVSSLCSL